MNTVGTFAIAVSGNAQQGCCQRQNPLQQAMQQILSYIQGYMAGQMVGQMMHGNQNGCMCSQHQNPNFGGQNPVNSLMAGMQMGAMLGSMANQGSMFGASPFGGSPLGFGSPLGGSPLGFGSPLGGSPLGFGSPLGASPLGFGSPLGAPPVGFGGGAPMNNFALSPFNNLGFSGLGSTPFATPGFNFSPFGGTRNSNGLLAGMPSLGLMGLGGNYNSLYNGLPGSLGGLPNPYELGQPITGLAQGLPPLAFNVLGQNPNPGFAGGNNILGLIPNVFVPPLQNSLGATIIPAGSGIPTAFGNNLGGFLG